MATLIEAPSTDRCMLPYNFKCLSYYHVFYSKQNDIYILQKDLNNIIIKHIGNIPHILISTKERSIMKWFKKNANQDERIINLKNKVYKEAYILIMCICGISILIKSFLYWETYTMLTELIVILAGSIYFGVRSVMLGIYSDEVEVHDQTSKISYSLRNLITGLIIGISMALFLGIRSSVLFADTTHEKWWYFFLVFTISLLLYIPLFAGFNVIVHHFANKASQKAARKDQWDS